MEQIMVMIEGAKKGRMMNIKENFHINQSNHANKLIQEQKVQVIQNSLFDFAVTLNSHQHLRH
jgi:hypothetical protein